MRRNPSSREMPDAPERRRLEIHDGRHRLPVEIIDPSSGCAGKPGETMIFLHEGLGSIAQWRDFPQALCRATGLPAVVYERWGYGSADPLEGPRTVRYLHDEALRSLPEVMRQLRIDRSILIGHSDGGSIALLFASAWPEKVRGIVTEAAHVFVEEVTLAGIREAVKIYASSDLPERLSKYHGGNTEKAFRGWSDVWLSRLFGTGTSRTAWPAFAARSWRSRGRMTNTERPHRCLRSFAGFPGPPHRCSSPAANTSPTIRPASGSSKP